VTGQARDAASEPVLVEFGCYECLRPHDGPLNVTECPWCGGFTGPMPADEQPTPEARAAVLAWEADDGGA
jgi:hypothetical protein